jgi:hypothetical protein
MLSDDAGDDLARPQGRQMLLLESPEGGPKCVRPATFDLALGAFCVEPGGLRLVLRVNPRLDVVSPFPGDLPGLRELYGRVIRRSPLGLDSSSPDSESQERMCGPVACDHCNGRQSPRPKRPKNRALAVRSGLKRPQCSICQISFRLSHRCSPAATRSAALDNVRTTFFER